MTITTSSYTANSLRINVSNETSSTNIITAIQQGMYRGGWSQYDISTATVTVGALYSPITTLVYSAPNADGFTTKYMLIRIDTVKLVIYTSACESWNDITHVPTNETWTGGGVFQQGYDIKDSIILINATQRHCVIWTFIRSEPGLWSGVFEFERVAGEDSATVNPVPNWAWTNSLMLGTPYAQANIGQVSPIMLAFCRTPDGFTGARAAATYATVTNRGMFPPNFLTGFTVTSQDPNGLHLGSYANSLNSGTVTYGWDPFKTVVSPVSADAIYKYMPFGRAYNMGITKPLGGALDTVFVNLDNTGGWPNAAGTSTECLLLPLNGGSEIPMLSAMTTGTTSFYTNLPTGTTATKVLVVGNNVWISSNTGIYTYDQSLGQGGAVVQRVSHTVSAGVLDIVFDGSRTVYGSLANGIVAVDTELFTTSTIATLSSGTSYLGIDGKYVYGVSRTALVNPWCWSFSRASFAVSAGFVVATSATVAVTGFGTPVPDYNGFVYLATQAGGPTPGTPVANTMWVCRSVSDTGVGTQSPNPKFITQPFGGNVTPGPSDSSSSWYFDYTATPPKPYLFVSGIAGQAVIYDFLSGTLTSSTQAQWTAAATGLPLQTSLGTAAGAIYDYRGDLNIMAVRGQLLVTPKKVGTVIGVNTYIARILPNSPQGVQFPGQSVYISGSSSLISAPVVMGCFSSGGISNGVRHFTALTVTANTDNRVYVVTGLNNVAYSSLGFAGVGKLVVKG
jgi:hypothetical protein